MTCAESCSICVNVLVKTQPLFDRRRGYNICRVKRAHPRDQCDRGNWRSNQWDACNPYTWLLVSTLASPIRIQLANYDHRDSTSKMAAKSREHQNTRFEINGRINSRAFSTNKDRVGMQPRCIARITNLSLRSLLCVS